MNKCTVEESTLTLISVYGKLTNLIKKSTLVEEKSFRLLSNSLKRLDLGIEELCDKEPSHRTLIEMFNDVYYNLEKSLSSIETNIEDSIELIG